METLKPRKWQKKALNIWSKRKHGITKVVTGGGKTFFACFCIQKLLEENIEGLKIIIFVPSLMLIDQWEVELKFFFKDALSISTCSGGIKPDLNSQVIISTLGSGKKVINKINNKKNVFCIVDECHRAGSEKRSEVIKHKWGFSLGLSATPERHNDNAFEEILVPFLGEVFFSYDYLSALRDGVISEFDLINVYVPLLQDEQIEYDNATRKIGKRIAVLGKFDRQDSYLKILLIKRARIVNDAFVRAPAAKKIINLKIAKKWLVFCEQIKQADIVAHLISKKGLRVTSYHTGLPKVIRSANLSLFRDGMVDVLVSCKSLDEGFDVPNAEGAIIVSGSATIRQRIQRMGRVLRKTAKKDRAKIYTFYSTENEKDRLEMEALDFGSEVNVKWLKVEQNV